MMITVTKPIKEAMSGMPGIARVKSVTARGATEIDLFFDWRANIEQTLQMVQSRVSQLSSTLPPGAKVARVEVWENDTCCATYFRGETPSSR